MELPVVIVTSQKYPSDGDNNNEYHEITTDYGGS